MSDSNSTPARRSQRARKVTTKHADTLQWTKETLQMLRASSDSSDRSSTSSESQPLQEDGDLVFENLPVPNDDEDMEEEMAPDQTSDDSTQPGSPADKSQVPKEIRSKPLRENPPTRSENIKSSAQVAKGSYTEKGLRNRMLPDGREILRGNSDNVYQQNYGPGLEDLYHVLQARDVWHGNPRDITLPSRRSISTALGLLSRGYLTLKADNSHLTNGQTSLTSAHPKVQMNPISLEQALKEHYLEIGSNLDIVLGPWTSARKYMVEPLKPWSTSEAWIPSQSESFDFTRSKASDAKYKAWLINTGARSQCMAWAPCNSKSQFLAVSFKCSQNQRVAASPTSSKLAPAFSPSPQFPSHMQIWEIQATGMYGNTPALMDFDSTPILSQVLCMKWGNVLRFDWVPLPQDESAAIAGIRTLAILTSDGCIRLIDIDLRPNQETAYMACNKAKIVLKPSSSTVYTTFCFASPLDIIAGAADGTISIYNLAARASSDHIPEPYLTLQLHSTYIMSVVVPTELPHYVCSSSAGGELMLIDLRSPTIDKLLIHKARHATRNLSYLPFVRTFVTTNDAAGNSEPTGTTQSTVIAHSLRHFQYTNTIMKLPEASGLTTCLATSPFHPCILVSNAQGSVFATNHLRRYIPVSTVGSSWMQKIFEYDWQPLSSAPDRVPLSQADPPLESTPAPAYQFIAASRSMTKKESMDIFHGRDVRPGISRIHEGFRPERVDLSVQPKRLTEKKPHAANLASAQVVFHEEQAVTAMAWNPNPMFAGWTAVAWGSGCLRIQDLSHDLR